MSPNESGSVFYINGSNGPGYFVGAGVSSKTMGIRPVLSLKSCVKYLAGDGSSNTPYEVTIDSTCASLEN